MQPVYVTKADPRDRTTWMDRFIATEPKGGFKAVVELAKAGGAKAIFLAILAVGSERSEAAA